MAPLAEAFVRVRAETDNVRRETERDFRRAGGDAGRGFGQEFSRGFTRDARGRLHDEFGRYVRESRAAGQAAGAGFGESFEMGMTPLVASAALLAGPLAAAGTAVAGFAAVAAPSIIKVISAQEDLAGNWDTLSRQQRVSATSVAALTDEYQALAKSYEPQALQAFNSIISSTRSLLPHVEQLVGQTSVSVLGFTNRLGDFVSGPEVTGFLNFASRNAPQALDQLGTAVLTTGSLSLRLVEDLTPLGLSMLTVANGALGLANAAAHVNPNLAQFAVTALLLRGPITGLIGGVGNMASRMRVAGAAAAGLSRSGRLLNMVTAAGPNLYVAAGIGLGFLALKAISAKSSTDKLIENLHVQNRAVGNNVAGYQALIAVLEPQLNTALQNNATTLAKLEQGNIKASAAVKGTTFETDKYSQAIDQANTRIRNITTGQSMLAGKYGITSEQAKRLADAAGVDLSTSIDKSGQLTAAAAAKVDRYRQAVELANNPTRQVSLALADAGNKALTMKDRVTALTTALDLYFNPSIAAYNATTSLKTGYQGLITQLVNAKGRMDGNTAASGALRQAFAGQLTTVRDLYLATFNQTHSTSQASAAVRTQLPILYALAGRNRDARTQVDMLARSTGNATGAASVSRQAFLRTADSMGIARERAEKLWKEFLKIKSRRVSLDVDAKGHWQANTAHDPARRIPGLYAKGGNVPMTSGAKRGRDSVPALLMPDEHVWTTREVSAVGGHGAMYRLRQAALAGELHGYAKGGPVTMTSPKVSGAQVAGRVFEPIHVGSSALAATVADALAAAWKKYAGSGGPVVAAARSQIGVPYVWGGTAWNQGLDCSGLTQGAWKRGRGIDISRTTYTQHPRSRPIGEPRPGALGFNSSLGHVVLASNRPGYVIEAPYTGARVREVRKSMPDWRWPKAAGYATGGAVSPGLGDRILRGQNRVLAAEASMLGLAGDPSGGRRPLLYDGGGLLPPGPLNRTGRPEPVLTGGQWDDIHTLAQRGSRQGPLIGELHLHGLPGIPSDQQISSAVDRVLTMHGDW